MEIITGRTGHPHVYAADDAEIYRLFLGNADIILQTGNMLDIRVISPTVVHVLDGSMMMQGRLAKIRPSDGYDTLTLDAGTTGYKRVDLIVAEYSQQTTETQVEQGGEVVTVRDTIETVELKVIKGTPNASAYIEPTITTGNIDAGQTHQVKLWAVRIDGINFDSTVDYRQQMILDTAPINTAVALATSSIAQIRSQMSTLQNDVYSYTNELVEGISQGIKGSWKQTVNVTSATSAISVTMPNSYTYNAADVIDVYLNGLKLASSEYSVTGSNHTISVTLTATTFNGQMEVVVNRLSTEA